MQITKADLIQRLKADPYRLLRDCKECGLLHECESPIMQGHQRNLDLGRSRVMIVGEAPGFDEDQMGIPFVGKAGSFLRQSLTAVGINPDGVRFTNAIACRPPGNDLKYQPKAWKYCKGAVWQEIQDHDPDIVLMAGNVPTKSIIGLEGITKISGQTIPSSRVPSLHLKDFPFPDARERVYVPILHPSYVLRCKHQDNEKAVLERWGRDLRTVAGLLSGEVTAELKLPPHRVIEDFDEAVAYLESLLGYDRVPYDYETPDLDPYQDYSRVLCVSFAPQKRLPDVPLRGAQYPYTIPEKGVCIPLRHDDSPFTTEQCDVLEEHVRNFLRCETVDKVAWNHTFEIIAGTLLLGTEPMGHIEDPMYQVYAINEMPGTHGLKHNTAIYTDFGGYEREIEKAAKEAKGRFDRIPGKTLFPYNGMDAIVIPLCEEKFYHRLAEEEQWQVMDCPLDRTPRLLARMEMQGIAVNQDQVRKITADFDERLVKIVAEAAALPEVQRCEYLLRDRAALKEDESSKEAKFDAAVVEFKEAKAAVERLKDVDVEGMERRLEKIRNHIKTHEKKGVRLEEARKLRDAAKKKLTEARRLVRETVKKATSAEKKVERTRKTFQRAVRIVEEKSTFSLGKTVHVSALIYEILSYPVFKWTDGGSPSTDDEVIERYKKRHRVMELLHAYRQLTKIRSTYLRPLHPDEEVNEGGNIVKPDGKVHPNVKALARTGRLQSGSKGRGKSEEGSDKFKFNIQNLPRPFEIYDGTVISIRDCLQTSFICEEHGSIARGDCPNCGRIVESDYRGLEALTLGIVSQETSVLECIDVMKELDPLTTEIEELEILHAIQRAPEGWDTRIKEIKDLIGDRAANADFHRRTAAAMFGIRPVDVTPDQRQRSKSMASFGLLYGRAAPALAADMDIPISEAELLVDKFWRNLPNIKTRNEGEIAFAKKHGYVVHLTGRRRRLAAIHSPDRGKRGHAEREAVNAGIQGPCSDFNLIAAQELDEEFRAKGMRSRVIALVHDAIYCDCPAEEVLEAARMMKRIQESVPTRFPAMTHPLLVERKASPTMGKGKSLAA